MFQNKEPLTSKISNLEFICVHARRTDYNQHVVNNYHNAKAANASYFLHAMEWMRKRLSPNPVAFVVGSDDIPWCQQELGNASDVFIAGDGREDETQAEDLALLGSCNRSIIAYGTYSLTTVALAQSKFTLVFDTEGTNSKEMEFVGKVPGWYTMTNDGKVRDNTNVTNVNFELTFTKG